MGFKGRDQVRSKIVFINNIIKQKNKQTLQIT